MYIHTKLLFKKRDDYVEVCVYYSRHGIKFRESTGVKVLHKQSVFGIIKKADDRGTMSA